MTELLERAISAISQLSDEQQDAIAARLLEELGDDLYWESQFAATTDSQWDNLAALIRQDIVAGDVCSPDEVFPINQ